MRKFVSLLLAAAIIYSAATAFASNGEEAVYGGEESVLATDRLSLGSRWGWDWEYQASVDRKIPSGSAGFFLQLDGLQMDSQGNISGRPSEYFTDVVATATLAGNRNHNYAIAIGDGITEQDILAEVNNPPADDDAFDSTREQLMQKGYIRSNKGEVVPWAKLNSKNYGIDWYVFKHENDGWHIDGRIIDLTTNDIIDIVIPEDPKDIPPEAYDEEEKDTSIDLHGARFAYVFGYEPLISTHIGEDGSESYSAEVYMGMDDSVTTEQVSAMLVRLLDQEGYTGGEMLKISPSVEPYRGEWYARGLAYEALAGGLPTEGELPLGAVNRGLVAKLVSCALGLNLTKDTPFSDISGNEYEEYIKKVYAYGYMYGVSDDSFAPDKVMTRAEFCTLFNHIIGRSEMTLTTLDADGNAYDITAKDYSFVDMSPEHWAYKECLKATSAYDDNGYVSISIRQDNIRNKLDGYKSQLLY